jgi:hypothetical protein
MQEPVRTNGLRPSVVDATASARGFTYQLDNGEHGTINPGSELTYVGGDTIHLRNNQPYIYDGKVNDDVLLVDKTTGEERRLRQDTFVELLIFQGFRIH